MGETTKKIIANVVTIVVAYVIIVMLLEHVYPWVLRKVKGEECGCNKGPQPRPTETPVMEQSSDFYESSGIVSFISY